MGRPEYDRQKEHEVIGMYPGAKSVDLGAFKSGVPESPKLYRPIDRRDNFKMLFRGETPYWIPTCGWVFCDTNNFRPRQHPDNYANHQPFDGGPRIDYETAGNVLKGWFDVDYQWEEAARGATVKPGVIKVPDITHWEDYVSMPNLDDMDWGGIAEMNKSYLDVDKANQLGIQFGMWERLMNLMGVAEAAIALVDEDQKEGVHRFFDQLADVYIDYIQRICSIGPIDSVFFHDDWGTQNGPFFSLDTCKEMIVPHIRRVTDACHKLGLVFEHHCCGKADALIPAMIEEGDDYWYPQPSLHDIDAMIEMYQDAPITFAVGSPIITSEMSEQQVRELGCAWVQKYKDKGILLTMHIDPSIGMDAAKYAIFEDAVYEYSRLAYENLP